MWVSLSPLDTELVLDYYVQQPRALSSCSQTPPCFVAFGQARSDALKEIMSTLDMEATYFVTMQLQYMRQHNWSIQMGLYSRMFCKFLAPDVDACAISINTLASMLWSAQSKESVDSITIEKDVASDSLARLECDRLMSCWYDGKTIKITQKKENRTRLCGDTMEDIKKKNKKTTRTTKIITLWTGEKVTYGFAGSVWL